MFSTHHVLTPVASMFIIEYCPTKKMSTSCGISDLTPCFQHHTYKMNTRLFRNKSFNQNAVQSNIKPTPLPLHMAWEHIVSWIQSQWTCFTLKPLTGVRPNTPCIHMSIHLLLHYIHLFSLREVEDLFGSGANHLVVLAN